MLRCLLLFSAALCVVGQASAQMTVQECVRSIKQERQRAETYIAKVTAITYGAVEGAVNRELRRFAVKQQYECAYDQSLDALLIIRNNFASNLAVERSGLLLKRGDLVAVADQGVLTTDVRKDDSFLLGPDGDFLNPMLVGISGYFELHNFVETEDHYKFWSVPNARFWKHRYIGDQLVFNRGREKVVFDKRFGFGITKYKTEGKEIAYTCSYKKVQGLWLPDSARIESGSGRHMAVDIEWVAVNRPIDERLFDPLWIARQAGLEWEAE